MSTPVPSGRSAVRSVLIVEDNDDVREMIRLYLEAFGLHVTEAADGTSGLDAALRDRPDLVLMDLGLPGIDGFALARSIRDADPQRLMRIVAMSGYAREHFPERTEVDLVDRWLVKPVAPDVLLGVVQGG
ncbi:MAG: response regulator [Myxococcota bacterium]|nr:response regulator [Myxococcota bacterium]